MPSFARITSRSLRLNGTAAGLITASLVALLVTTTSSAAASATFVSLGTADSFAILAGTGISNTGPTLVTGNIGSYPTTTITGTGSMTLTGTNHGGDALTQSAKTDLVTAYTNVAAQVPTAPIVADLGGTTLLSGVYNSATSIGLTGNLNLDAQGDANAVFVFQAGSTLTTAAASTVTLLNGAQACNVFWQVGSSATLGTNSAFRGNVLALTSITMTTGATSVGRMLARNGAVVLNSNSVTAPTCAVAPPVPTPTATVSPTPTATPSVTPTVTPSATPTVTPSATVTAEPVPTESETPTVRPTEPESTPDPITTDRGTAGGGAGSGTQVPNVPAGGVSAGDGSSSGR